MLEQVDLSIETPKETYKPLYDELMTKLVVLQQRARAKGIGLVVLFEGWNEGWENWGKTQHFDLKICLQKMGPHLVILKCILFVMLCSI